MSEVLSKFSCDHISEGDSCGLVVTLVEQNAKLRELSSIMLKCIMANERKALICWECPMHKQFDELRSYCCLKHEASEMGIEVTK